MGMLDAKSSRRRSPWRIDRTRHSVMHHSRSRSPDRPQSIALPEANPNYREPDKFAMITAAMARANMREVVITLPSEARGRSLIEPMMFQIELGKMLRWRTILKAEDVTPMDSQLANHEFKLSRRRIIQSWEKLPPPKPESSKRGKELWSDFSAMWLALFEQLYEETRELEQASATPDHAAPTPLRVMYDVVTELQGLLYEFFHYKKLRGVAWDEREGDVRAEADLCMGLVEGDAYMILAESVNSDE